MPIFLKLVFCKTNNVFFISVQTGSTTCIQSVHGCVYVIVQDFGFFREPPWFKSISCVVLKSKTHVNWSVQKQFWTGLEGEVLYFVIVFYSCLSSDWTRWFSNSQQFQLLWRTTHVNRHGLIIDVCYLFFDLNISRCLPREYKNKPVWQSQTWINLFTKRCTTITVLRVVHVYEFVFGTLFFYRFVTKVLVLV